MTIDRSCEQIDSYYNIVRNTTGAAADHNHNQMMATSTMTANTNHFKQTPDKQTPESLELSTRLTQIHLKDREANIPRRQPTIVCEDIADDIDFDDEEDEFADNSTTDGTGGSDQTRSHGGVVRSASTASLTVPQQVECDDEKRRPPLPTDDQMMIESN